MTDTASDHHISTVNLVRSTHPWTKADSAAGFVLRYLIPMRRQLVDILGTTKAADDSLKLLLGHLVSVGFGDQKQGRLRDYLIRAVRSAAKTHVKNSSADDESALESLVAKLDSVTLESKVWLAYWRDGLLQRAWRSLERVEHSDPQRPLYAVLSSATDASGKPATAEAIAMSASKAAGRAISSDVVQEVLPEAKTMFAQFIADEISETLEAPNRDEVKAEIMRLGLAKAFEGIQI